MEKDTSKDDITTIQKAVRLYCFHTCSVDQRKEVTECHIKDCELWNFRDGKSPFKKKRILTDEQLEAMKERFALARAK